MKNKIKNIIKSKSFIIAVITFMAILVHGCTNINVSQISTYKSIKPITTQQMENMSARSTLELLVQQDNDLTEYVNKHKNEKIDKLFETFYRNLLAFAGRDSEMDSKLDFDSFECVKDTNTKGTFISNGIVISYNNSYDKSFSDFSFDIREPKTNLIKLEPIEEGWWGAEINHNYLINRYSKYLNGDIKTYLMLDRDNWWLLTFYDTLKFDSEYPNSIFKDIIDTDIKEYMERFSEYQNYYFGDNSDGDLELYKKFLTIKDNNREEYKQIKEFYGAVKKDDLKRGINYYSYLYNLTKDEYYKNEYEKILYKLKIEQDFNNLKYDKEKLSKLYEEASDDWEIHQGDKDKNGNFLYNGTSSGEYYITDYIEQKAPEFKIVLDTISNYCRVTTEAEVYFRNCYIEKIKEGQ